MLYVLFCSLRFKDSNAGYVIINQKKRLNKNFHKPNSSWRMIERLRVMTYDTVENLIGEGKERLPNKECLYHVLSVDG